MSIPFFGKFDDGEVHAFKVVAREPTAEELAKWRAEREKRKVEASK